MNWVVLDQGERLKVQVINLKLLYVVVGCSNGHSEWLRGFKMYC